MELFLMVLCMSLLGLAVTSIAFAGATRNEPTQAETLPERPVVPELEPSRFFAGAPVVSDTAPRVPIEALLLQIERHIRLEQAAAESFLDYPTVESLHTRTMSPLVH